MTKEKYDEIFIPIITSNFDDTIIVARKLTKSYIMNFMESFILNQFDPADQVLYKVIESINNLTSSFILNPILITKHIKILATSGAAIVNISNNGIINLKDPIQYSQIVELGNYLAAIKTLTSITSEELLAMFPDKNNRLLLHGFFKDHINIKD